MVRKDYRNKGYATDCLKYAKEIAEKAGCYKMMLLTGSKKKTKTENPEWEKIKYVIHRKSKNRGSDTKIIVTIFFGLYTSYTDSGNRIELCQISCRTWIG